MWSRESSCRPRAGSSVSVFRTWYHPASSGLGIRYPSPDSSIVPRTSGGSDVGPVPGAAPVDGASSRRLGHLQHRGHPQQGVGHPAVGRHVAHGHDRAGREVDHRRDVVAGVDVADPADHVHELDGTRTGGVTGPGRRQLGHVHSVLEPGEHDLVGLGADVVERDLGPARTEAAGRVGADLEGVLRRVDLQFLHRDGHTLHLYRGRGTRRCGDRSGRPAPVVGTCGHDAGRRDQGQGSGATWTLPVEASTCHEAHCR